ncbi:cyclase family protein [Solirubrum puertoriconensis]|uniref:Metal-dependent hydrolase n=1 Tax=Solirubrum puertoriconensis TaxID=1751427 RepID=A0A9X0HHB4_SOLP1|nr:cyclase family protein [Solirubrum puertoriconensis]KUG05829.1 metal-dependent hydrolase [Solirubrum puertoriconensis]
MLTASIQYCGRSFSYDPTAPISIALPLAPGPDQVNCFWAEPVQIDVIRVGGFVGSVAEGGSTNYKRVHVTPHGNGTHTECFGHISPDAATLPSCLKQYLFVAWLISVEPHRRLDGDYVVELSDVQPLLQAAPVPPQALVIRTMPNDESKRSRQYSGQNPPYISAELAQYLVDAHIEHLLLDLPSVDRELDNGILAAHHIFWQYPSDMRRQATITELIFVPDAVPNGLYLLNLQVTALELDASPSNPVLYLLTETDGWAGH